MVLKYQQPTPLASTMTIETEGGGGEPTTCDRTIWWHSRSGMRVSPHRWRAPWLRQHEHRMENFTTSFCDEVMTMLGELHGGQGDQQGL
jgi:hypothetical protein